MSLTLKVEENRGILASLDESSHAVVDRIRHQFCGRAVDYFTQKGRLTDTGKLQIGRRRFSLDERVSLLDVEPGLPVSYSTIIRYVKLDPLGLECLFTEKTGIGPGRATLPGSDMLILAEMVDISPLRQGIPYRRVCQILNVREEEQQNLAKVIFADDLDYDYMNEEVDRDIVFELVHHFHRGLSLERVVQQEAPRVEDPELDVLGSMIDRFEREAYIDTDFDHSLAAQIMQELAECQQEPRQAALFADVRKLADHMIDRYMRLDREDRLKMAIVYEREECFREIGPYSSLREKAITSKDIESLGIIGPTNFLFLCQISSYSKLIPVLENYIWFVDNNFDSFTSILNKDLTYYFDNYDAGKNRVRKASSDSLYAIERYDFRKGRRFRKGEKDDYSTFDSLTYGVTLGLRKKVETAGNLEKQRRRMLEHYLVHIRSNWRIIDNIKGLSLSNFLLKESLRFYNYDFRSRTRFAPGKRKEGGLVDSMTLGLPEKFRREVMGASHLVEPRISILKNYIQYVKESDDLKHNQSSITYYLTNFSFDGVRVGLASSDSMNSFRCYDFKDMVYNKKGGEEAVFDSMTYLIPEDLKEEVLDAKSLVFQREKALRTYVQFVEENKERESHFFSLGLANYLISHNQHGEKVLTSTTDSMAVLYLNDFRTASRRKDMSKESLVASMTYRIKDEELVRKVWEYALAA